MLSAFDISIISWFNQFAFRSWRFDYFVYSISDNHLLKGGLFVACLWAFWFLKSANQSQVRKLVISTFVGCVLAIGVNKGAQIVTVMRPRPYIEDLDGITFPFDMGMKKESSFPSDHAALFFALSTGIYFLSRRAGLAAFLYTAVVICLPRIYLGLHYPSDLLGGACIGIVCASLAVRSGFGKRVSGLVMEFSERRPATFHTFAFLFTYQLATLFDDVRMLGNMAHSILLK